jgi:Tfp pilus assembly protein PilF
VHGFVRQENGRLLVRAYLTDARSNTHKREWTGEYAVTESRYIPVALAGMVTGALRLPALTETAAINAAALQDYRNGLWQMRRESGADAAIASMEKAVNADPDSPLTHAGQAEAWWWKYFVTKDRKYLTLAETSLAEAQRRNGDLAPIHRVAGLLLLNKDMPDAAVNEFLRTIELDPASSDGHRSLAMAFEAQDKVDQAVSEYRRAIELDPEHHRNHQALGAFYYNRAEYAESLKHFRKAVELAPQEAATHFAIAAVNTELGEYTAAEGELRTALALGETPVVLNNLGVTLMYQNRDQEATLYLKRALDLWPQRYLWWLNLGIAYRRLQLVTDSERANLRGLAVAEAELMKNPRNGAARGGIAYLCARLGDKRRAEFEVAQALSIAPNDSTTRWMALLTFEALGRRDDSLSLLKAESYAVLADVSRFPDLAGLAKDPAFQNLLAVKRTT